MLRGNGPQGIARTDGVGPTGRRGGCRSTTRTAAGDDQPLPGIDSVWVPQAVGIGHGLGRRAIASGNRVQGLSPLHDVNLALGKRWLRHQRDRQADHHHHHHQTSTEPSHKQDSFPLAN